MYTAFRVSEEVYRTKEEKKKKKQAITFIQLRSVYIWIWAPSICPQFNLCDFGVVKANPAYAFHCLTLFTTDGVTAVLQQRMAVYFMAPELHEAEEIHPAFYLSYSNCVCLSHVQKLSSKQPRASLPKV